MVAYTFSYAPSTVKQNVGSENIAIATFDVATKTSSAGLANGDTISGISVPANATITGYYLIFDELDSNGSPTGTISLGDSTSSTRFLSAVALGGSATKYCYTQNDAPAPAALGSDNKPTNGIGYTYASADTIKLTVDAALATAVTSGQIVLMVRWTDNAY